MLKRIAGYLILLAVVLVLPSCRQIQGSGSAGGGPQAETLAAPDAIQADWGNLVAVSSVAQYPDLAQLWFQDRDANIRVVVYNTTTNQLLHAKLIRRK
jgi:hypothetical protein